MMIRAADSIVSARAVLVLAAVALSCSQGEPAAGVPPPPASGKPDGGSLDDVSTPPTDDAGTNDGPSAPDSADVERRDASTGDAGGSDANAIDATTTDRALADAVTADVGSTDVGPGKPDAAIDTGSTDSGGPGAGFWLKGDLHAHSLHSTDALDSPVADVLAKAEQVGFDYFSLTDHDNHVQGNITTWGDPAYQSSKLILLYGIEWTSARGHANIFGTKPYDYAPLWATHDAADGRAAISAAHAQGLFFFVNHPAAKDLWECGFDLDFDGMEVWTAPFVLPNSNSVAITHWEQVLLSGRRVTARGGSDSHHQKDLESALFNVGNPTTWVYARERTGAAVLEALKAGHVSISYAPGAERIDFTADADGDGSFETMIGDNVASGDGKLIRFKIEIVNPRAATTYRVAVFKNGAAFDAWETTSSVVTFEDTPAAGSRSFYRVEVRGPTPDAPLPSALAFGDFIALTNPIYISF